MERPAADVLLLNEKLRQLRDAAELLVTQLLSPFKNHHASRIDTVTTSITITQLLLLLLSNNHN